MVVDKEGRLLMKKLFTSFALILSILVSFSILGCSYSMDYDYAEYLSSLPQNISVQKKHNSVVVTPENFNAAFVFYPGAYVDYEAYLPMIVKCAQQGVKCFIVDMPSDLALFNISAADKFLRKYPEITEWYVGGHSLGGAMAASYVSKNSEKYKGLVLMAAFSTADISNSGLKVLSLYGSEDGVLGMEKYNSCKANLPADFEEHVIEGGNHAQFGSYGEQNGDNEATITPEEQWNQTGKFFGDFVNK